ncbi:arsenate reductase ArsC [Gimesia aquarii]|uniref:Arsenate-mycothiol transferase ArsC2 n=1 Tax=Gimesia aquarii TaxID=2527964 RepID=A0A517X1Z0_9PLAN|nr:arsenate reductase ArsC [Gimesia aquarii]QDU11523.1 Arsenate-mycothiol transferase ArsC2 [Gimesia aquarii]
MKNVLILCTGNSCRSQMAEALWRELGQGEWESYSAGSLPSGYVHPMAIEVMQELDQDLSQNRSKHVDEYLNKTFDLVVTVCDSAKESCPTLAGAQRIEHWPFYDPADAEGSDTEKLMVFRDVRDQIREKIQEFLKAES